MKILNARLGIAVMLLAGALPPAARALSPEETVSAAERAEKAGSLQQAADLYNQFLNQNPDHVQRSAIYYRLAVVLDNIGDTAQAEATLKQAVSIPADRSGSKHRPDAFMHLARLQADAGRYADAADTLQALFKEGAGLYEDEAQNLRAGYLTIVGKYDEAAILFNVLRNKQASPFAKEAGYKLAIVWMKAGNDEMARNAIEEFIQRHPGNPRAVELFIRLARMYYDKKDYRNSTDICRQVMNEFKEAPEAIEAAFIIALSYRDAGKLETAVERLTEVAKLPQAAHNSVLASESLFEAAQICRKSLNNPERASDLYNMAASAARDGLTERQREILEQSLFYEAEHLFKTEKWSAAHDLYAQLRKMGSKLNLLSRVLYCQSKMSADGGASMVAETEEELNFIRQRIAGNPNTLIALQSEIFLIDRKLNRIRRDSNQTQAWPETRPLINEYAALLAKYPADVLKQQNIGAYINMRMGGLHGQVPDDDPQRFVSLQEGIKLLEQSLAEAPEALFRVEGLESLAFLAGRASQNAKAFTTYKRLLEVTGQDPAAQRRPPAEYLQGLVATAASQDLADEAMATMRDVISKYQAESDEAREAAFYLAELLYMKQRFSEAAKAYRDFVRMYGPPQGQDGKVLPSWKKPQGVNQTLDQVYEAGLRIAHCWRTQGHTTNMVAAYRWVIENQSHLNPRVAEAAYMTVCAPLNFAKLPPARKEEVGRELWTQVVNPSLDFGSKAFREGFMPWVRESRAVPFVRVGLLKAAQLTADSGNHRRAAQMYEVYLDLYPPDDNRFRAPDGGPAYKRDEFFFMASYAVGREYILAGDSEAMMRAFPGYVDGMRDSKFRAAALQVMGHYGTQAELYSDAANAYAALMDEYGPPNPTNAAGVPIPVRDEERILKGSSWNGIRMPPPEKWDPGQIRFGLGFLYWKKEQWDQCGKVLQPFLDDPALRGSSSRGEALFMLGRSLIKTGLTTGGQGALERLTAEHPDFKGIEEAYMDLIRFYARYENWSEVRNCHGRYVAKFPDGLRRTYMDVYAALGQIGRGEAAAGEQALDILAKSDTYEDVKAEAYYRLALRRAGGPKPDIAAARSLLRKSVECYPMASALLETARLAMQAGDFADARTSVDRLLREFPKTEREFIEEAQQIRRKLMLGGANTGK